MALEPPFRDHFIPCGCLEYYASGAGMARHATDLLEQRKRVRRGKPHSMLKTEHLTAQDVFRAYDLGDPIAQTVVNTAITFWGMAVANLVSAFNPEKFVLGGGLFGPAGRFLPQIRAEAQKWAQPVAMRRVTLEVSKLGTDTALYGAAFLAAGRDLSHIHDESKKPQRAGSGYV
jgi:glucokinase